MKKQIIVLGAGPAGLALAMKLLRRGDLNAEVTVLEQNPHVGGLATSFEHEGLYLDYGSHRLHPATAPEILKDIQDLLGEDLLDRPRDGRIYLLGKFIKFPFSVGDLLAHLPPWFALGIFKDMLLKPFKFSAKKAKTFSEALLRGLGPTICQHFYFPYARKLWGLEPEEISVIQAERRVSASGFLKIIRKVLGKVPGFQQKGKGRFYYPRKGYGQISNALAEEVRKLGGKIETQTKVTQLKVDQRRVSEILIDGGKRLRPDFVFSTIPVTVLGRLMGKACPSEVQQKAKRIRYRAMVLCYLVLETKQFTPYDAHYFPNQDVIFSRLSEPKNYSATQKPDDVTIVCAEIPCLAGDNIWNSNEHKIGETVIRDLNHVGLRVDMKVTSVFLKHAAHVYPLYSMDFEDNLKPLEETVEAFEDLIVLGRQGLFAHDNTHHTIEMAYRASECLCPDLSWKKDKWFGYKEAFKKHVVED